MPSPLPTSLSLPLLPLLLLLLLSLSSLPLPTLSETVLYDNCGQGAFLPTTGGNTTVTLYNPSPLRATSPYRVQIAINDGIGMGAMAGEQETFFISPPPYGDATLVGQVWNPDNTEIYQSNYTGVTGNWSGSAANPITTIGLYTFTFTIPMGGFVRLNVTYTNTGLNPLPVTDVIVIIVKNPVLQANPQAPGAVGDPQFVGLRGQSYQVHGIDGAVYNILTDERSQVNSRFVFLNQGECPVLRGKKGSDCWSHPGSYLGEMSFQQLVDADGAVHRALITSGPASTGFLHVLVDDVALSVGEAVSYPNFSVSVDDSHRVTVTLEQWAFTLHNSDRFINQAVRALVPLSSMRAHGLLGQTHVKVVYPTAIRFIEGKVDDYLVESDDMWGSDFVFNRFQHSTATLQQQQEEREE